MYLLVESYANGVAFPPVRLIETERQAAVDSVNRQFANTRGRCAMYLYSMAPSGASIELVHSQVRE